MSLQHSRSVLALLVLLGAAPALGARIGLDTASNSTAGTLVPHFDVGLKGVLCAKIDFGPLVGILANYPETENAIREKALYFANEENCRLCDVSVTQTSMQSPTVTCAAATSFFGPGNTDVACLKGNGKPAWHSGYPCVPCPEQCGDCERPGTTDTSYWGWFKCVFAEERENQNLPAPWNCEDVQERRKHRGQMAWCKYRKDLASTSTNGLSLEDKAAAWSMKIAGAHCSGVAEGDELEGPVQGIVKTIAPALTEQFSRNCELCRITAGGPISSGGVGDFKFAQEAGAENTPWAFTKCAYDELGVAACRTDRGPVGWDKDRECAPCPTECASCAAESSFWGSSDTFSCKLRPTAKVDHQLARLLTSSRKTPELDSPPKLPHEDFNCGTPEPRDCTSGEGLCMGYEVSCKFMVQVD